MKRGYMNWDKQLLPEETLKLRRAEIVKVLKEKGLNAAVVYGDVINADELVDTTNYGPYWCNTSAIITADGEYVLVTGHNARVNAWLSEMTGLPEDKLYPAGPKVPAKTVDVLKSLLPDGGNIGLIGKYTLASTDAALRKAGYNTCFLHKETDMMLAKRDGAYKETVKQGHRIMEQAIDSALVDIKGKTVKQICAEIEYEVRRAGAMDIYQYASLNKCEFTLPTETVADRWNIYMNIQYLGEWMVFAFPISSNSVADYSKINAIAANTENLPANAKVRNRVLSDSLSSLNYNDDKISAVFVVSMLDANGDYYEKMFINSDNKISEFGMR